MWRRLAPNRWPLAAAFISQLYELAGRNRYGNKLALKKARNGQFEGKSLSHQSGEMT
jgi:hypothetical protein